MAEYYDLSKENIRKMIHDNLTKADENLLGRNLLDLKGRKLGKIVALQVTGELNDFLSIDLDTGFCFLNLLLSNTEISELGNILLLTSENLY